MVLSMPLFAEETVPTEESILTEPIELIEQRELTDKQVLQDEAILEEKSELEDESPFTTLTKLGFIYSQNTSSSLSINSGISVGYKKKTGDNVSSSTPTIPMLKMMKMVLIAIPPTMALAMT